MASRWQDRLPGGGQGGRSTWPIVGGVRREGQASESPGSRVSGDENVALCFGLVLFSQWFGKL